MPPEPPSSTAVKSGAEGKKIVEERVRDEIARGAMAPGYRLVEAELAERYGVSRHSARLGLDGLMTEGLVERIPNRGARVRTVSDDEAVEIMEARMVLDGLLSRRAAEVGTDDEIAAMVDNLSRMEEAVAAGELLTYSNLIQVHHGLVRDAARQPIVSSLVDKLQAQIVRHQFQLSLRPGRAQQSLAELRGVVEAIRARDPELAEQMARAHLRGVVDAVRAETADAG